MSEARRRPTDDEIARDMAHRVRLFDRQPTLADRLRGHAVREANELEDDLLEAATLLEQQAAEIERLRVDAGRLDWLDANGQLVFKIGRTWYSRPDYGMPHRRAADLRAAIDAAVSQAKDGAR